MPPRVERFSPEVPVEQTGYFWLQLDADLKTFDINTFDQWAKTLRDPKDSSQIEDSFTLKWIVRGERMIFFSKKLGHAVMNYGFDSRNDGLELKSAGFLSMNKYSATGGYFRTIYGNSMTLDSILSEDSSNEYKLYELPQKLNPSEGEPFFEVR